ncbi:MAG: hypothetical protein IH587_06715 [Anaerolineae bacterium]|nr:hypothetical protein [Anaerolineae bacterium]
MGGWHYDNSGDYADRSWPSRRHSGLIRLLIFALLLMVFLRSGAWWMIFALWWIVPAFSRGNWGMSCANNGEKHKRDSAQEKPKRGPVYIYGEDGEPLEVVESPEKPKRSLDDSYDYM